jgi:hypothetical protein
VRKQDDNPVANQQDEPPPVRAPKMPTFSVVIENVSSEITAENVIQYVPELQIKKAWRIISLIRIVTDEEDSLDKLLIDGIELYRHLTQMRDVSPSSAHPRAVPQMLRAWPQPVRMQKSPNLPQLPR